MLENMSEQLKININESDVLKVFAVTAVTMQSVLGFVLKTTTNVTSMASLALFYNMMKYTAPMFIFAIMYGMVKSNEHTRVSKFYHEKFFELVVPYILWAAAYVIIFPDVQIGIHADSVGSYIMKLIDGDIAPHLWYTVMMLQFQILMPITIFMAYKFLNKASRVIPCIIGSAAIFAVWIWFYQTYVFHAEYAVSLRYLDRVFVSYFFYAVLGSIAWVYKKHFDNVISKIRFVLIPAALLLIVWATKEIFSYGFKEVSFGNIPYLKASITLYSLVAILLVYIFGRHLIMKNSRSLPIFKWLSTYAYRAYLANVFLLQIMIRLTKNIVPHLPTVVSLVLVYLLTMSCSFLVAYALSKARILIMSLVSPKKTQDAKSVEKAIA